MILNNSLKLIKNFYKFFIKALSFLILIFISSYTLASESGPKLINKSAIIPGSKIQAYKYLYQNGLQLIVIPDKRNPVATIHFMLDAGSNREQSGTTGLAHFFEHMMFRKSKEAPEGNYDKVLNSVGGSGNAGTSDSFVTFYSTFPGPALESMLKLESTRFKHLDIVEPYFSIEKGAVISERKLRVENDPMARSSELLRAIVERNTPMEWMTIGAKYDVENMTINAASAFYKNFYTPDNTLMIVGGPFDHQNVANLVQKYFSDWKGNLTAKHPLLPENYFTRDLGKKFICSAPVFTKKYKIIYPNKSSTVKDIVYSLFFQSLLDDHKNGTFERRLVKEKLSTDFNFYKVYWQNQNNPYIATFSLSKDQKFESIQKFWEKGVDEVLKKQISQKIRRQILKQLAVSNAETAEKMTNLVSTVIDNSYFLKNFNSPMEAERIVKTVTTEDFHKWIKENLNVQKYYITGIVTPSEAPSCPDFYSEFQRSMVNNK